MKTEEIPVKYLNIKSKEGEFRCLSPHPYTLPSLARLKQLLGVLLNVILCMHL